MAMEIGSFTLVCAEALQDIFAPGGQWHLPEITTERTGNRCSDNDSLDNVYMNALIQELGKDANYDATKLFFAGCSMGSQFSLFYATCRKIGYPKEVSAFATHCSGLKVKGDNLPFPSDNYHPRYSWGECPKCHYHPIVPKGFTDDLGLKACVFENVDDEPNFQASSKRLVQEWRKVGNRAEEHRQPGGHCDVTNVRPILQCLDDGRGWLLPNRTASQTLIVTPVNNTSDDDDNKTSSRDHEKDNETLSPVRARATTGKVLAGNGTVDHHSNPVEWEDVFRGMSPDVGTSVPGNPNPQDVLDVKDSSVRAATFHLLGVTALHAASLALLHIF